MDDLHRIKNEMYPLYFTFDGLKNTPIYYFGLVERFLKLSSTLVWAIPGMSCYVNVMGFVCVSVCKYQPFDGGLCPIVPLFPSFINEWCKIIKVGANRYEKHMSKLVFWCSTSGCQKHDKVKVSVLEASNKIP